LQAIHERPSGSESSRSFQRTHKADQNLNINDAIHNNPPPARNHDLNPTATSVIALAEDARRNHSRNKFTDVTTPAFTIGLAPREQELLRNPVTLVP